MSKFVLHIGLHKTGSTAIQSAFKGFDDGITKYADLGYENHSIPFYTAYSAAHLDYHIWKTAGLTPTQIERKRSECIAAIKDSIERSRDRRLIFSGEDISLLPETALRVIAELFGARNGGAQIIAYVRAPLSFIQSNFQEELRAGRGIVSPSPPRYRSRLEKFIRVFSQTNVVVRNFDRASLHEQDVIKDFSSVIGVMPPREGQHDNASVSTEAVKVLYHTNNMFFGHGETKHVSIARQRMVAHLRDLLPGKLHIPPSLLSGIVEHDDLDWLHSVTGIDFRFDSKGLNPFSKMALHGFLSEFEAETLKKIRHYLSSACGMQKVPDEPLYVFARYFMSFMPSGQLNDIKFNPKRYLELNPDVEKARVDPYRHYLEYGIFEGRRTE